MDVRRVVTGHDEDGRAVFVSDERVAPVTVALSPGSEFHLLWGADGPAQLPDNGARPPASTYFPPVGGYRFGFFSVPPEGSVEVPAGLDIGEAVREMEEKLPGLAAHMERGAPGMHTTATVDFEVVLHGEVTLELDDGATRTMGPGDTVVQNGTRHRWSNRGTEPAVLAVMLIGAHHTRVPPST